MTLHATVDLSKSLEERINLALESIRPYLNKDGGDIELVKIHEPEVDVRLIGTCNGCPMSFSTMKLGVESTIRQYAPEITTINEVGS